MKIFISTKVDKTVEEIYPQFSRELFVALTPPLTNLTIDRFDGCKKGDEIHLKIKSLNLFEMSWVSVVTCAEITKEFFYFIDEGVKLPLPLVKWKHVHRVEQSGFNSSLVIDDIEYQCGNKTLDFLMYPILYQTFFHRKKIYKEFLEK